MKIVLVDLPTALPVKKIRIQPPNWASYLASYLSGEIDYLDGRIEEGAVWEEFNYNNNRWWIFGLPIEKLAEKILSKKADIIGIHIGVSTELGVLEKLVAILCPRTKARIILGGTGIATVPVEYLSPIIRNCKICATIGIGNFSHTEIQPNYTDINMLPKREIWKKYSEKYQRIGNFHSGRPLSSPSLQIITSIGCGGNCSFCASQNKKLQRRNFLSIQKELTDLKQLGINGIQIEDDNFLGWKNEQISDAIKILDEIVAQGFEAIEFPNGLPIRPILSPLFISWLNKAIEKIKVKIALPFESADDETLQAVSKPHRHKDCVGLIVKLWPLIQKGLHVEIFLQVGFITFRNGEIFLEGENSISKTINFAEQLKNLGIA